MNLWKTMTNRVTSYNYVQEIKRRSINFTQQPVIGYLRIIYVSAVFCWPALDAFINVRLVPYIYKYNRFQNFTTNSLSWAKFAYLSVFSKFGHKKRTPFGVLNQLIELSTYLFFYFTTQFLNTTLLQNTIEIIKRKPWHSIHNTNISLIGIFIIIQFII